MGNNRKSRDTTPINSVGARLSSCVCGSYIYLIAIFIILDSSYATHRNAVSNGMQTSERGFHFVLIIIFTSNERRLISQPCHAAGSDRWPRSWFIVFIIRMRLHWTTNDDFEWRTFLFQLIGPGTGIWFTFLFRIVKNITIYFSQLNFKWYWLHKFNFFFIKILSFDNNAFHDLIQNDSLCLSPVFHFCSFFNENS